MVEMVPNKIISELLLNYLTNEEELLNALNHLDSQISQTFQNCYQNCIKNLQNQTFEIETVIDFLQDELNTGHWSEVPLETRRAFTAASFVKCLILLQSSAAESLTCLDMGLLLGAPLQDNHELLTKSATFISSLMEATQKVCSGVKRKSPLDCLEKFEKVKASEVETLSCPSIELFQKKYFATQVPVKITDSISHWPALEKWGDVDYLLGVAGERTVPIEIGSHYVDENWCQKLVKLKDFIEEYFLGSANIIGYLAQHNLFNQIPELRGDIYVPDYCSLGEDDDEPDINAWLGPEGTVSPLHQDPKNNFLAQVFGAKQLILFSPQDSQYLYPHDGKLLSNTAQVDPLNPDYEKYPDLRKSKMFKCLLEPGDIIFIPKKWWHHVTSLDKSFSVSFWWN